MIDSTRIPAKRQMAKGRTRTGTDLVKARDLPRTGGRDGRKETIEYARGGQLPGYQ